MLTIFNVLSIGLIGVIIWLMRSEQVTTKAGQWNRAFIITVAVVQIGLILMGLFFLTESAIIQLASFTCSLLLLMGLLLSYKMR